MEYLRYLNRIFVLSAVFGDNKWGRLCRKKNGQNGLDVGFADVRGEVVLYLPVLQVEFGVLLTIYIFAPSNPVSMQGLLNGDGLGDKLVEVFNNLRWS